MLNHLDQKTDEELWLLLKNSDNDAFSMLYQRYVHILYNFGKKVTSDHELIVDTLQELFTNFWERRTSLSKVDNVKVYILKSCRYKLIHALRKKRKIQFVEDYEQILEGYLEDENDVQLANERRILLKKQLNKLPKQQREIIHLRYFQNLDNQKIAEIVNINYQSVSNTLYRAIKRLRSNIEIVGIKETEQKTAKENEEQS